MARNGSGTAIPPVTVNPVVSGTVITSNWANTTITDTYNELTNSLPRDGQAPMLAPLKIIDGSVTTPGLSFNSESATGLFRPSSGNIAITVAGVELLRANSAGRLLIGTTTDDGSTRMQVSGSVSATSFVGPLTGTVTGHSTLDLPLTGGTLTGNLTVSATGATLAASTSAGNSAAFSLQTGGLQRWSLTKTVTGESGSNAGSDLQLIRYSDAGTAIDAPVVVNRATGLTTISTLASSNATLTGGTINNIAIGATTPGTGNFAALSSTSMSVSGAVEINGNVGINLFPSAWTSTYRALEIQGAGSSLHANGSNRIGIGQNFVQTGSGTASYAITSAASAYQQITGTHNWFVAPSGTAGTPISFATAMTLDGNSNLGVGQTPAGTTVKLSLFDGTISTLAGYNYASNTISGFGTNTNHSLGFITNGGERMRIDTGGNVTINATSSNQKLTVNGGVQVTASAALGASGSPGLFSMESPVFREYVGDGTGWSRTFSKRSASVTTDMVTIQDSGNVGIGTVPAARLDVATGTTNRLHVSEASSTLVFDSLTNAGTAWAPKTERATVFNWLTAASGTPATGMTLDSSGNLLVNSTTTAWGSAGRGLIEVNGSSTALVGLKIGNAGAGYMYHDGTNMHVQNVLNGALTLDTDGVTRLSISNAGVTTFSGAVSMGGSQITSAATEALRIENDAGFISFYNTANTVRTGYIQGDTPTGLQMTSEVGSANINSSSSAVNLQTAGTTRLSISSAGVIADGAGNELGYKGIPVTTGGLVRGQCYTTTAGFSVGTTTSAGDTYTAYNNSSSPITITQLNTMFLAGTRTTGNRTLAAGGFATIWFLNTTTAVVSGNVS